MALGGLKLRLLSPHKVAQGLVSASLDSCAQAPMGQIQAFRYLKLVENTKYKGLSGTKST